MTTHLTQIYLRVGSRLIEAFYGFIILIYLNKILPNSSLDFFQLSFFIIGIFFLILDYGRLQHVISNNNAIAKKEYLATRLYFLIFLVTLSIIFVNEYLVIIIFSILDIGSKNNLYDYRKVKHSAIYFLLNIFKVLLVIYLYFNSNTILPITLFLAFSIVITHINSHIPFALSNIRSFILSNRDRANFLLQIIVIIKSFFIYFVLTRLFEFDSSESRAILFLSNVCFTLSMVINSSIINIVLKIKDIKFFLFSSILSIIISAALLFLYTWVPELKLPFSNILLFSITFFACLFNLNVYFYVTKIILSKKASILIKLYILSILILIIFSLLIYSFSLNSLFIIILFEFGLFFLIIFNRSKLKRNFS